MTSFPVGSPILKFWPAVVNTSTYATPSTAQISSPLPSFNRLMRYPCARLIVRLSATVPSDPCPKRTWLST